MRKIPMRQCIGCMNVKPKDELVRILRTPEGDYTVDKTGKKNGRGAYICNDEKCLDLVIKRRSLDRSFKEKIDPSVYTRLKDQFVSQQACEEVT